MKVIGCVVGIVFVVLMCLEMWYLLCDNLVSRSRRRFFIAVSFVFDLGEFVALFLIDGFWVVFCVLWCFDGIVDVV